MIFGSNWQNALKTTAAVISLIPALAHSQEIVPDTPPITATDRQAELDRDWLVAYMMDIKDYRWDQVGTLEARYQRMAPIRLRTLVLYYQQQEAANNQRSAALLDFRTRSGMLIKFRAREQVLFEYQAWHQRHTTAALIAQERIDQLHHTSYESYRKQQDLVNYIHPVFFMAQLRLRRYLRRPSQMALAATCTRL